jgi:hypothetical protein
MIERYQHHSDAVIIEPVYCPEEGLWYAYDGMSARTLRELLAKIPGAVIEGYYPEGFDFRRPRSTEATRSFTRFSQLSTTVVYRKAPTSEPAPAPMTPALEGSAAEFKPVAQLKPEQKVKKRKLVPRGPRRASGQKNAKPMFPKVDWSRWDAPGDSRLQAMVDKKFSGGRIAEIIGCARNAIFGRCHRRGYKLDSDG